MKALIQRKKRAPIYKFKIRTLMQKGNRTLIPIWHIAPLCLVWCVWRERNARCFEDCEIDLMNLKKMMLQTLFMWREKFQFMHKCSYFEFIDRCSLFSLN
jgi:hypothetical protein